MVHEKIIINSKGLRRTKKCTIYSRVCLPFIAFTNLGLPYFLLLPLFVFRKSLHHFLGLELSFLVTASSTSVHEELLSHSCLK